MSAAFLPPAVAGVVLCLALVVVGSVTSRAWGGWPAWVTYAGGVFFAVQALSQTGPGGVRPRGEKSACRLLRFLEPGAGFGFLLACVGVLDHGGEAQTANASRFYTDLSPDKYYKR